MNEPVLTPIQTRFCDTDMLGHINNAAFAEYSELGRMGLFASADAEVTNLILARLAIDYVAQVTLDQEVVVSSRVEKIGRTSIVVAQQILADGEVAAKTECVVVYFDYETQAPAPVPNTWRQAFGVDPA
jgi:acyl-CoA thioester hydrolase